MATKACAKCPDPYLDLANWIAIDNRMPPQRSFYVQGDVIVPTLGYAANLKKASPQGTNPAILLLDLHVRAPGGPVPQVVTPVPVRYDEAPYADSATEVHVRCGSVIVLKLDVQEVS